MSDWEMVRDRLLHDDFGGDGTHPARRSQRWLDVHAALERVEEQAVLIETLEGRIKGLHQANDSFGDLAKRVEAAEAEIERLRAAMREEGKR